jgi:hypothetical protein
LFFSKYEWGKGQTGGKNYSNTFVPIAFNFFVGFNILKGKLCLSQKLMVFWISPLVNANVLFFWKAFLKSYTVYDQTHCSYDQTHCFPYFMSNSNV